MVRNYFDAHGHCFAHKQYPCGLCRSDENREYEERDRMRLEAEEAPQREAKARRERIATAVFAGMLASHEIARRASQHTLSDAEVPAAIARGAVNFADALIAELDK